MRRGCGLHNSAKLAFAPALHYLCPKEMHPKQTICEINAASMEKIGIASDHAGYEMKEFLIGYLGAKGFDVYDFGTDSPEAVDYADYAHPLAEAVEKGEVARGIALCGSGEGMALTLNKHQGIRAGLVWRREIAELIKKHNDANIVVLPARFITNDEAVEFIETYLAAQFEGGRHARRIAKIALRPAGE